MLLNIVGFCPVISAYSQNSATEGVEFYLAFTYNQYAPTCQIRYAVSETCRITAQYGDGTYIDNNVEYAPGIYTKTVDMSKCYIDRTTSVPTKLGIKVTSTRNIALFAINMASVSTDATTVLPVTSLGNNYTIISHTPTNATSNANILIIAPTDGTVFTIRKPDGTVVVNNQSLSSRQAYVYRLAAVDLTGYTVESNYNTAVYSTLDCGVQAPNGGCDHNYEQMWPTNTAGKNFFLWNLSPSDPDQIKVLALENNTVVTKKVGTTTTILSLNKHEISAFALSSSNAYVNNSATPVTLFSNKPIIVDQVLGYAPSLKWWTPLEQSITSTVISPFIISSITQHKLHLMIPAGSQSNMIMTENRGGVIQNVTLTFYTNQTDPNYVIATKNYTQNDDVLIELKNPAGFIAYMHGIGGSISYIFTAGAGAFNLQSYFTIGSKTLPYNDTYYSATSPLTHTFESTDNITVKRTIEKPFTSVRWLINGTPYTITENININNTLTFPAAAFRPRENMLSMSVRFTGAAVDSVYTGNIWLLSIKANDDTASTTINTPVEIDVLENDSLRTCRRNNLETVAISSKLEETPKHGNAEFRSLDTMLIYTPTNNWYGLDSLRYVVTDCHSVNDSAWVYIVTSRPLSKQYTSCPGAGVTMGFAAIADVRYDWYNVRTGGSIVLGGGNTNTLTVTKDNSALQTWWVEPVWKGIKFPRYQVNLLLSDNCGTIDPMGCAVDGTLLFKEDFGGNDIGAPKVSTTGLPPGVTDYNFSTINNNQYQDNTYWLLKYNENKAAAFPLGSNIWHTNFSDHTHLATINQGYMFMVDAGSSSATKFYECTINGLCEGTRLYFSARLVNMALRDGDNLGVNDYPNLEFEISDGTTILGTFVTGTIPRDLAGDPHWRLYGFSFEVPHNTSSVKLKINNYNKTGWVGNDFAMDDIEIRLCVPAVTIAEPNDSDTTVCLATEFVFKGDYIDNNTFSNDLKYYWEHSTTGNVNDHTDWNTVSSTENSSNNGAVSSNYTIATIGQQHEGYYRLVVSNVDNDPGVNPNCRAISRVIYLGIHKSPKAYPDIRIQACTNMGEINLSSYLDTTDFVSVEWKSFSLIPPVSAEGRINSDMLATQHTYVYNYKITNTCYDATARVYIRTVENSPFGLPPDTVIICWENAEALQLNQILGIEAGGNLSSDATVMAHVKKAAAPKLYSGAMIFNGQTAYKALLNNPTYVYTGPKTTGSAIQVKFTYAINNPRSCLNGKEYELVLILTDELTP